MSKPPEEPTGDQRHSLPDKREPGAHPAPTSQKSYSVEEMMSQLRSPDGKKRRRRSHQPIYESRKRRRVLSIVAISLVTLGLGGCFGFRWFQKLRLQGETFRDTVSGRISEELDCLVEFGRFHDGGDNSLGTGSAKIELVEKDLLDLATFENLNASLTAASWVSEEWGITKLTIDDAKFQLNPERSLVKSSTTYIKPTSKRREKSESGWRMGISPSPDRLTLDRIHVARNFTLEWPARDTEQKTEGISRAQATATLPPGGSGLDGFLLKGQLALRGMPPVFIQEIRWKLNGRKLSIDGSNLTLGSGLISAAGEADLQNKGSIKLSVDFTKVPVASLFSKVWGDRLSGLVNVKNATFTAAFTGDQERVMEGDFSIEGLVVHDLAFVTKIAGHLQRPDYSHGVEFPTVTGHFLWTPSKGLQLSNISGERPLEVRIGGSFTAGPQGNVNATISISAHKNIMTGRSDDRPHPFKPFGNGDWFSASFNLSGAGSAINDDLPQPGNASGSAPSTLPPQNPQPRSTSGSSEDQFNKLLQPR